MVTTFTIIVWSRFDLLILNAFYNDGIAYNLNSHLYKALIQNTNSFRRNHIASKLNNVAYTEPTA